MENIKILYYHHIENYFEPNFFDYYDFEMVDGLKESIDTELVEEVKKIKSIIICDFQRVLLKIANKNNNLFLVDEIENLIESYNNDVDVNLEDSCNYIFLNDQYLYFNNIENYVDDLLWGSLGDEADVYETIVIVNRNYTEFHFITIATNLCNAKKDTTIKNFIIEGEKIQNYIYKSNQDISFYDYRNEEGIKRLLSLVKK